MNPMDLLKQAKAYLTSPNRNRDREAEIKRKAGIYQALINDTRYKEVQADLFARKITEKEKTLLSIPLTYTLEQIGKEYLKLRVEIEAFSNLLNSPDRYFAENEKLKVIEELERKEKKPIELR